MLQRCHGKLEVSHDYEDFCHVIIGSRPGKAAVSKVSRRSASEGCEMVRVR